MAAKTRDLTEGPVWRALASVSAPMSLGILAVLSVGLADAFFLSKLGGAPLAAVGYIYPVTAAITSLSIGLSAAANAVVSTAIGKGESDTALARVAVHVIGTGIVLAAGLALLFWLGHGWLFGLLGASGQPAEEIGKFIPWWCLSFPFLVLTMQSNAIFRAHGRAGLATIFMVSEAVLNIALTPVLVFGLGPLPELGTAGAAMATMIARICIAVAAGAYAWKAGYVDTCEAPWTGLRESLAKLARIGGPASFSSAINPAGMAAVTAAVSTLGESAVAGFGAATRVQSLALVPLLALSSGIGPVVGQNRGAEDPARARAATAQAFAICLAYGLLAAIVLTFFATPIAALLTPEGQERDIAAMYLRYVGWSLFGYGILVVGNAAMNARDRAFWSMGLSLGRILIFYIPLAWIGVTLFGFPGIVGAAVIANLAAALGGLWATARTDLLPARDKLVGAVRETGT